MAKKWKEIRDKMSPEARADVDKRVKKAMAEMPLHEVRLALNLSQQRMAELLEVNQSEISKLEHRTDTYVSTVRSYIEAMGGRLDLVARMPGGDVRISNFENIRVGTDAANNDDLERPANGAGRKKVAATR